MRYLIITSVMLLSLFSSCNKYLDVVPDNVATIDMAFRMRVTAEQYLFTCYSYLPNFPHVGSNPALYGADELWRYDDSYPRSEEHTSELQSLIRTSYAVFCLKKKTTNRTHTL